MSHIWSINPWVGPSESRPWKESLGWDGSSQSHCIPRLLLLLFTASLLVGMRMSFKFPSSSLLRIAVKCWEISVLACNTMLNRSSAFRWQSQMCIYSSKISLAPLLWSAVTQQWRGEVAVCSSHSLLHRMRAVCCEQVEQMLHEFNSFWKA